MARVSYERALQALRAGDRVMVTHPHPMKVSEVTSYTLLGGGSLTPSAWQKLEPHLRPVADGLFGAFASQTYELVR